MNYNHDTVLFKDRKVIVDKTQEKERYTALDSKEELQCSRLTSSRYFEDNKEELGCTYGKVASSIIKKQAKICDLFHVNQIKGDIINYLMVLPIFQNTKVSLH